MDNVWMYYTQATQVDRSIGKIQWEEEGIDYCMTIKKSLERQALLPDQSSSREIRLEPPHLCPKRSQSGKFFIGSLSFRKSSLPTGSNRTKQVTAPCFC
ncbi:hypothetical protein PCANC_04997 [Puccinia coronata f. sp. avenae]|uniref:Uncharacterized protein n=1 Tax=Puccinia coronata f. sp. avenae TaxID=200324 RepID=A0A2N5TBP2_9BASI|nr:hypothetical protein PCANC_04997 [Puccinia coronata f. sp. avenae]PLW22818.1 hypothetical protein PCASD_12141 [Puccinia coronata f. sp. avenae]